MNSKEKFYVLIWNLKEKKPDFKIRFKRKILKTLVRPKLVLFVLENRLSFFARDSLSHLIKIPIQYEDGKNLFTILNFMKITN